MSDHLQALNKTLYSKAFSNRMPVATDAAFQEKLAHKKRSNVTYSDFARNQGRDNKMYHLSDGYNLNKKEDETVMDECVTMLLYAKQRKVPS